MYAATLTPGSKPTAMWRLLVIQTGRLAIFATAVVGSTESVINSQPLGLSIAATRNLRLIMVLPVAIGVSLGPLGESGALLWRRRIVSR